MKRTRDSKPVPEQSKADTKPGNMAGVCAHCGSAFEQTDLGLLSDCIMKHKPVCSYACNKALGQA